MIEFLSKSPSQMMTEAVSQMAKTGVKTTFDKLNEKQVKALMKSSDSGALEKIIPKMTNPAAQLIAKYYVAYSLFLK